MNLPEDIGTRISAEIGCNHCGDLKLAKKMIRTLADACVSVAKFQKRTPSLMSPASKDKPYDNPHSFGKTYGEHRAALEFTAGQHADLWNYARMNGIEYAVSVWDEQAFEDVKGLTAPFIKIPSARNEDLDLLQAVAKGWRGEVHLSNGMCDPGIEGEWKSLFGDRLVVYVATSTYPCRFSDVCLKDIIRLREKGFRVGLSGHHSGIAIDVAAAAMGVEWIERHFTLDRAMKGTDHAASLETEGITKLVRDVDALKSSWNTRHGVLPCEVETRAKLKVR
jgi:sialic acid synthase